MGKLLILLALVSSAVCQYPQTSTNYQTADSGRQESVNQNGDIQGQYSYVDPNGKTITVKYTAGKGGFQVQGDHLPVAPQGYAPQPSAPAFQPTAGQYNTQYNGQYNGQYNSEYDDGQYHEGQYNNYVNSAPTSYQQQVQQAAPSVPNYQGFNQQKNLFTPAQAPFPAATSGQFQNYQKALEEEREDAQKSALNTEHRFGAPIGAPDGVPQTPYNIQYGADNGYSFEYNF